MPPKRVKPPTSTKDSGVPTKKPKVSTKTTETAPKLQESTTPNWKIEHPKWSDKVPKSKHAKLCIEKWCLLPPYDHEITGTQWKAYYQERSALDKMNTCGSKSAERSGFLEEYLCVYTWWILEEGAEKVAAAIYGSVIDQDERVAIARTLRGSLYFTAYSGSYKPCTISANTRLYSPFGIGTSVDLAYYYFSRIGDEEQCGSLVAMPNKVDSSDPKTPWKCKAAEGYDCPRSGSITIFSWTENCEVEAIGSECIDPFELTLFGRTGWLSPLKMHNLLCAAGTVLLYEESTYGSDQVVASRKNLQFFEDETAGEELSKVETNLYYELKGKEPPEDLGEEACFEYFEFRDKPGCVPKRLLLLARQGRLAN